MKDKNLTIVIHGFFRNGPPGLSNNAKNLFKAIKGNYKVFRNNINYKNLIYQNNLSYRSNFERTKNNNILLMYGSTMTKTFKHVIIVMQMCMAYH